MSLRKTYIAIIVISLFCLLSQNSFARKSPLELTITFDKKEYTSKDPIKVSFTLKNRSKKPIYVNKRFFINSENSSKGQREIYFEVISPSKKKLPFKISPETGLPRTDHITLLNPGEKATTDREKNIKFYFDFDETGTYKIKAFYQNIYGKEIGIDAYKGKVVSKPVTIKIIEETKK